MDKRQLPLLFLSLLAAAADTQTFRVLVRDGEVTAVAGDTVTLSVRPSAPVISGRWIHRSAAIVTWTFEPPYLNVAYNKRNVQLLDSTSLRLRSVGPADSGVYRLTVDSPSGQEATANITLHVVPKPAPFSISTERRVVNASVGDTVRLRVTPSMEVRNGSWQIGGKVVARWTGEVAQVAAGYRRRASLVDQTSLQLNAANTSDSGEYRVTMSTGSGLTETARIQLNVFTKPAPFSISTERRVVNAWVGDTVRLRVTPSMEVRNGSWQIGGKVVARWTGEVAQVAAGYRRRASLFDQRSLQLNAANTSDSGEYRVTMSTGSGLTETARIQLNVFREAEPLTVTAVRSRINAEKGAKVLLSVRVTGAVRNGTWRLNKWPLVRWNHTDFNGTIHRLWDFQLLPNASLVLGPSFMRRDTVCTIRVSSFTGEEANASITMRVYAAKGTCDVYNSVLGLLILLTLAFILFFVVFIHKNRPKDYMEKFDLLVVFCKGYRTCLSFATILTIAFVLMFGVKVNRNMCTLGKRPEMDFVAM